MRIMLFQGSPRYVDNCPDQSGKTALLAEHIINNAPDSIEIDYCDLAVKGDGNIIQPCKACVSTAIMHCHYPCDCYVAGSDKFPDFMHNNDIYGRLESCDGFIVLTPVHWYAPSTPVKALFDRLVCINSTLTTEVANDQLGIEKDSDKSRAAERSGKYHHLLKNHYEGKFAAFFIHGDAGGEDYREFAKKPKKYLPTIPDSFKRHLKNGDEGWVNNPRNSIMPLVWQCRYSGIYVPEDLIVGFHATKGISYSDAMDLAENNLDDFYQEGSDLLKRLIQKLEDR